MTSGKLIYSWDSSIFIAWLKGESRDAGDMEGLTNVVRQIDSGKVSLIVSTLIRVEVLTFNLPDNKAQTFFDFLKRSNVAEAAMDFHISNLAYEIRNFYKKQGGEKARTVSTPDAIHLATAIHYNVSEFHTFNGKKKSHLGLLPLNGNVAGHPLKIVKPMEIQLDGFSGE